jgi:AcrR family transcriptional regulator
MLDAANELFAERGYEEVSVEDIARSAGVARGLVHHYFGGRKEVYLALLERLAAVREDKLPPSVGRSARARVENSVSRWLDWTEANRMIYLGTIAPGEDLADPEVRQVVAGSATVPSRCWRPSTPTSPRTRPGCATPWSAGPA